MFLKQKKTGQLMSDRYIPPIVKTYTYPKQHDQHMITVKEKFHPVLDENYPFREKTFWFYFKRFWLNVLLNTIVIPSAKIRYAIKVEGKKNIRKYRKDFKNGYVTVCNHIAHWDFLMILCAMYPRKCYFPIWENNMRDALSGIYKTIGGIPVPTESTRGGMKFMKAMNSVLEDHKWLHVYPEGSMWFFFPGVRNFKEGAFVFAYKNNVPVIPLAITYRPPKGIYKLFKKEPCTTVHIGEPIMPDKNLSRKEAVAKLASNAHLAVVHMMGIKDEKENEEILKEYIK